MPEIDDVETLYKQIVDAINTAIEGSKEIKLDETSNDTTTNKLKEEIKSLIGKLRIKGKSKIEKIELNIVSRLIRNKIWQKNEIIKNKIILKTLEGNRNI